jgi:hypothetical protein
MASGFPLLTTKSENVRSNLQNYNNTSFYFESHYGKNFSEVKYENKEIWGVMRHQEVCSYSSSFYEN